MPESTVFISAKSEDYPDARRVFNFLTEQGIGCFFSDESLMKAGRADYKDAIDSALDEVLHLIVVTSSRANVESTWVKYEWNTFSNELLAGRKHGNLLNDRLRKARAGRSADHSNLNTNGHHRQDARTPR